MCLDLERIKPQFFASLSVLLPTFCFSDATYAVSGYKYLINSACLGSHIQLFILFFFFFKGEIRRQRWNLPQNSSKTQTPSDTSKHLHKKATCSYTEQVTKGFRSIFPGTVWASAMETCPLLSFLTFMQEFLTFILPYLQETARIQGWPHGTQVSLSKTAQLLFHLPFCFTTSPGSAFSCSLAALSSEIPSATLFISTVPITEVDN